MKKIHFILAILLFLIGSLSGYGQDKVFLKYKSPLSNTVMQLVQEANEIGLDLKVPSRRRAWLANHPSLKSLGCNCPKSDPLKYGPCLRKFFLKKGYYANLSKSQTAIGKPILLKLEPVNLNEYIDFEYIDLLQGDVSNIYFVSGLNARGRNTEEIGVLIDRITFTQEGYGERRALITEEVTEYIIRTLYGQDVTKIVDFQHDLYTGRSPDKSPQGKRQVINAIGGLIYNSITPDKKALGLSIDGNLQINKLYKGNGTDADFRKHFNGNKGQEPYYLLYAAIKSIAEDIDPAFSDGAIDKLFEGVMRDGRFDPTDNQIIDAYTPNKLSKWSEKDYEKFQSECDLLAKKIIKLVLSPKKPHRRINDKLRNPVKSDAERGSGVLFPILFLLTLFGGIIYFLFRKK